MKTKYTKKTQYLLFLLSGVFSTISVQSQSNVTNSIDHYGELIRTFGQDSIYRYTKDRELYAINYLDTLSVINKMTFKDGKIYTIEYNPKNNPTALSEEYFENGILAGRKYAKDSTIVSMGHSVYCNEAYIYYYPNGKIKNTGQQGFFGAFGTSVGLHREYDENGKLVRTEDFIYPEKVIEEYQDREYLTYVVVHEYYANGKFRNRKIYRNYIWYETDYDEQDGKLGVWTYYDEQGNVVKVKKYSNLNEKTGENE